jgi:hypothetical protein
VKREEGQCVSNMKFSMRMFLLAWYCLFQIFILGISYFGLKYHKSLDQTAMVLNTIAYMIEDTKFMPMYTLPMLVFTIYPFI